MVKLSTWIAHGIASMISSDALFWADKDVSAHPSVIIFVAPQSFAIFVYEHKLSVVDDGVDEIVFVSPPWGIMIFSPQRQPPVRSL